MISVLWFIFQNGELVSEVGQGFAATRSLHSQLVARE